MGRRILPEAGKTLLEAAQRYPIGRQAVYAPCGGQGLCGRCRVRIAKGSVSPPTEPEQRILKEADLEAGFRLACQVRPLGPLEVEIPPSRWQGDSNCRWRARRLP